MGPGGCQSQCWDTHSLLPTCTLVSGHTPGCFDSLPACLGGRCEPQLQASCESRFCLLFIRELRKELKAGAQAFQIKPEGKKTTTNPEREPTSVCSLLGLGQAGLAASSVVHWEPCLGTGLWFHWDPVRSLSIKPKCSFPCSASKPRLAALYLSLLQRRAPSAWELTS